MLGTGKVLLRKDGAQDGTSAIQSLVKALILGNKGARVLSGERKMAGEERDFLYLGSIKFLSIHSKQIKDF